MREGGSHEAGVWVECDLPVVAAGLLLSAQAFCTGARMSREKRKKETDY